MSSRYWDEKSQDLNWWPVIRDILIAVVALVAAGMYGCPQYNVWSQGLAGEAELRRAEQNRKIKIQEATAHEESAKHLARAEIERAKGVAEANRIIGEGLKGNEEYLRYLWIMSMKDVAEAPNGSTVVYVPTEANLPIMEAGRLKPKAPQ